MASISHDPRTRRRTVQFVGVDDKRRSIRLGRVNKKQAESAKRFIEDLIACNVTGTSPKNTTAEWLASLPDLVRRRVERAGLVEPQERSECPTVAEWVSRYVAGRTDVKKNTRQNFEQAQRNLIEFFGNAKRLDEITPGDAEDFWVHLKRQGLGEGTVRRRCKRARQFFTAAVKKKIIGENPFADLKCGNYANAERYYFVSIEEAQAVLDACPDAEWRLIFALCRFGGLRCPSEILRLRWEDVDWERMRFTVHAAKTEHHVGSGLRQVPIFPELHPHLRDCFEQAEPGQEYAIGRYRSSNANLRTQLARIIRRAGLTPWPKLFQNLRSTRETELTKQHPLHVVCAWIGNSQLVAAKYYLQLTDEHFAEAVQNPVQYVTASARTEPQDEPQETPEPAICDAVRGIATECDDVDMQMVPPRGLEPLSPG